MSGFSDYLLLELNRSELTGQAYRRDVTEFGEWLGAGKEGELHPESVTLADIRGWLASLARRGETAVTVRRKAQSLRAFFRYLLRRKVISVNPTADLVLPKVPRRLPDTLQPAEVETSLRRLREEWAATAGESGSWKTLFDLVVLETLYTLGLRRAELLALDDGDLWRDSGELKIHGKRRKVRVVPVPQTLSDLLGQWQSLRDRLWERPRDRQALLAPGGKRATASQIYSSVRRSLAGTAAARKSPHALRHTFATGMLNGGADLNSVKEFLGHSSLATTQIYTHVSFQEMKKAYRLAHPRAGGGEGENETK